jgi:hypothetical protein
MTTTDWERRVARAWVSLDGRHEPLYRTALDAHLPRYSRSMAACARALVEPDPAADPKTDVRS